MTKFYANLKPTLLVACAALLLVSQTASASLVAHFEFEDGTGSATAVDSSGNGHTGTLLGGASIVNDVDRGLVYSGDGSGSYLDFDSTVAVPNLPANGGVTLAAWVKVTDLAGSGNTAAAITLGTTGDNPLVIMSVTSGGLGGYYEGTGSQTSFPGGGTDGLVAENVWTHIAITFNRVSHEAKLYVNGSLDATLGIATGDGELDWKGGADVGGYNSHSASQTFKGLIDDARYYDEVLDSNAIGELVTAVPEPTSFFGMLVMGILGLVGVVRRRARK